MQQRSMDVMVGYYGDYSESVNTREAVHTSFVC